MIKPFLTYQQQIQKLVDEKRLIVNNVIFVMEKLQELGYFTLIGGYKNPFRDPMTRVYIGNTTFEDVYTLYQFDDHLRELIFKYLCQIEKRMRSSISYAFCEQYLKVLVLYRNVCALNERLFSHKVYSEIPDTVLHQKLGITKNGTQYIYGKKDLFSVVISFRYFLPKEEFEIFKCELAKQIEKYLKQSHRISESRLLENMGFPQNWKMMTRYKV